MLSQHPFISNEYMVAAAAFDAAKEAPAKLEKIDAVIATLKGKSGGMFINALIVAETERDRILQDLKKPASHMNETVSSAETPALAH